MRPSLPGFLQDGAWQRLAIDIDALVRELVEQNDTQKLFRDLRQRLVKVKVGHIKLRLSTLKQILHQHLEQLEERLRLTPDDEEQHYLVALLTEHLADIWLMESLIERLTRGSEKKPELAGSISYELPSRRSSEAGGSL